MPKFIVEVTRVITEMSLVDAADKDEASDMYGTGQFIKAVDENADVIEVREA